MKNKNFLSVSFLLLAVTLAFSSCQKENSEETTTSSTKQFAEIIDDPTNVEDGAITLGFIQQNGDYNKFVSNDGVFYEWYKHDADSPYGENNTLGNVRFNYSDIEVSTTELEDGSGFTFITNYYNEDVFTVDDITINSENVLSMTLTGSGGSVDLFLNGYDGDLDSFMAFIGNGIGDMPDEGDELETLCPPCIFYGVATLIAGGVSLYCSYQQDWQTDDCTAQSQCTDLLPCGAECIDCPPNNQ